MAEKVRQGPLAGVKVLDMTEHMAGPYCTMILADMGAEVIKLERPGAGDSSRAMGDGSERNPYFRYINRNKHSLTLDYKSPRGREIFLKLVADGGRARGELSPHRHGPRRPRLRRRSRRKTRASSMRSSRASAPTAPIGKKAASTSSPRAWAASCTSPASRTGRPPRWACPSATSAPACGERRACSPRSSSASAPARGRRSSARSSRRRWPFPRGRARAGSPITWSPPAWARAIGRTRPTSASRPRTAT